MKNLKLFFIQAIVLSTFAINAKAQTKEETINWITEKISHCALRSWNNIDCTFTNGNEHYIVNPLSIINLNMISIIIKSRYPKDFNPVWKRESYDVNINNLTNAEVCTDCSSCSTIPLTLYFKPNTVHVDTEDANDKSSSSVTNQVQLFLNWSAEPNLQNRMVTALLHLVELNGNKQTF